MKKRVFTLTELVVVMVCFFVLAAVMSACGGGPLGAARERSRNANCVSKLKQIGLAEFMYSSANKDYLAVPEGFDDSLTTPSVGFTLAANGTSSSSVAVNAGDKLLMGGYFGSDLSQETYEAKESAFRCPSDQKTWQKSGTVSSYNNALQGSEAATLSAASPRRRMVVGRDNPGAAIWYDNHKGIYGACGGHNANNHPATVNVCYLGSHVGSSIVKNNSNGTWAFLDQITY